MLRHDTDANNRMKELMASLQNLTLGVRAVVSQAAAGPSRIFQCQWHRHMLTHLPLLQFPRNNQYIKQAGTGPSRRHIQGSKTAKGLPSVNIQYSKIEKTK